MIRYMIYMYISICIYTHVIMFDELWEMQGASSSPVFVGSFGVAFLLPCSHPQATNLQCCDTVGYRDAVGPQHICEASDGFMRFGDSFWSFIMCFASVL